MKNYHLLSTKVYLLLHYIHNITKLQKHLSIVKIFICMYLASHLHNVSKMNLIIKYVAKFLSKEDSKEDSTKENLKMEIQRGKIRWRKIRWTKIRWRKIRRLKIQRRKIRHRKIWRWKIQKEDLKADVNNMLW